MKLFLLFLCLVSAYGDEEILEGCEYEDSIKTYNCKDIKSKFPNQYYGNFPLQCTGCHIKVFSKETFPYANTLPSFNASESGIEIITKRAFSNLRTIQYLYLDHNSIRNISSEAFYGLSDIYEMHLEHNLLSELLPGFLKGVEATLINLSSNKIRIIPGKTFDGLANLLTLELFNNKIYILDIDAFHGLENLELLDLRKNKLCHIPLGVFKHLKKLRTLNLSDNRLSNFALGSFSGLKSLMFFNLANNTFSNFDASVLLSFPHLSTLDISGNGLFYVDGVQISQYAPTLRFLRIDNNLFSCANLKSLLQYLKTVNVEVLSTSEYYDVQNIHGIACLEKVVEESFPFSTFLAAAHEEARRENKFC